MNIEKKRRIRPVVEMILALLFLAGALVYVAKTPLKGSLTLNLGLKVSQEDTVLLFTAKRRKPTRARVKPTGEGEFQWVSLALPGGKIRPLRLQLGEKPGNLSLQILEIRGMFDRYRVEGKSLDRFFALSPEGLKGKGLLVPDRGIYKTVARMRGDKTHYYLLAVVLAAVFFYLVHYFRFPFKFPFTPGFGGRCFRFAAGGGALFLLLIYLPLRVHFNNNFNNNFPFRDPLIFFNNLLRLKLFGVSAVPKVLSGKDGWLFLNSEQDRPGTVEYYRSQRLFSGEQLEQWKKLLEKRYRWLAARGIHYLFVVVPNKNTVYPEFMPDHIRKVHERTRLDQLKDYLEKHWTESPTVPLLDLRGALLEAKGQHPVYYRTDTHWNDFGAYIASREIIAYVSRHFGGAFKGARPRPLSDYTVLTVNRMGGDLAKMLTLQDEVLREDTVRMGPRFDVQIDGDAVAYVPGAGGGSRRHGFTRCASAPLPNILMVHDSFYKKLKPFLSSYFSRVRYIWDWDLGFYPDVIEEERPVLVIDQMAERFLMQDVPEQP